MTVAHRLYRVWTTILTRPSWWTPLLVLASVFVTSWALMGVLEPGNSLVAPQSYWWWFLVTASTVGYGDLYPGTVGGRVVGAYVVLGGVLTFTTAFSGVTSLISRTRGRRMSGTAELDLADHLVLLGYEPGRTERLVRDVQAETEYGRRAPRIVVAAWDAQAATHPMPGVRGVDFVRGDLAELELLERACAERALAVLVDARTDDEAVTLTVAVAAHAPRVHTVVTLRDPARSRTVQRVAPHAHCVPWHSLNLVFDELTDPGIAAVFEELTTPGGASTWSCTVPPGVDTAWGAWHRTLGERFGATPLAVAVDGDTRVSPPWDTPVPAGATVFYVARHRIDESELARNGLVG